MAELMNENVAEETIVEFENAALEEGLEVTSLTETDGTDSKSKLVTLAIAGAVTGGAALAWHFAKPVVGKGLAAAGKGLSKLGDKLQKKKDDEVIDVDVVDSETEETEED